MKDKWWCTDKSKKMKSAVSKLPFKQHPLNIGSETKIVSLGRISKNSQYELAHKRSGHGTWKVGEHAWKARAIDDCIARRKWENVEENGAILKDSREESKEMRWRGRFMVTLWSWLGWGFGDPKLISLESLLCLVRWSIVNGYDESFPRACWRLELEFTMIWQRRVTSWRSFEQRHNW